LSLSSPVPVGHWNLIHAGPVHCMLDHLDEGVCRHIPLELVREDKAGVVVHHGDQVVVASIYDYCLDKTPPQRANPFNPL